MLKEPNPSPLQIIQDFLHQNSQDQLQITFAHLEIRNKQHGQLLHKVQRHQSRIILHKLPQNGLAEITVVDSLVFSFSFQFQIPKSLGVYEGNMLCLPRPLDQGKLYVDAKKLQLSFRIDAPDPALRIDVTLTYQGILDLAGMPIPVR